MKQVFAVLVSTKAKEQQQPFSLPSKKIRVLMEADKEKVCGFAKAYQRI